jgi:hypothetical protein
LINFQQSIRPKLLLLNLVLVALVENKVQNLLSFDIPVDVRVPNIPSRFLVFLIILLKARNDDQLLKGVVKVLLVVVKR